MCAQVCAWTCKTPLKGVGATARRRAGATARRHHPNPTEADRRWRGERSKPVRLGVRDHNTRSLCAESPAQTEQMVLLLCRRADHLLNGRDRGQFVPSRRRRMMANVCVERLLKIPAEPSPELRIPGAAAQTRVVSMAGIRLDPGNPRQLSKG